MSGPAEWPRVVLFDLDGTLIDSAGDVASSVNLLIGEEGHEPLSVGTVRQMIGNGVKKLVERAYVARNVHLDEAGLDARYRRMMEIYGERLTIETVLLDAAAEAVAALARRGVPVAVVTNKPGAFSRTILDRLGLSAHIALVVGGDSGRARKPAPDMLLYALEQLGSRAADAVMVGDGPADAEAARAAGVASIGVRGGYTNATAEELGTDLVIDNLGELPAALERMAEERRLDAAR